ncbi:MAG: sugar-binding protein [Cytophagales bacterium]|nr:sugar-binding protein [Cytophagales bacterium]
MKNFILILCVANVYSQTLIDNANYSVYITEYQKSANNTLKWLSKDDGSWKKGNATFSFADTSSELKAKVWMAMTNENLLIHVIVNDDLHTSNQNNENLWRDDALQISIDPEGQGSGTMPANTRGAVGADDYALDVALTAKGMIVQRWIFKGEFKPMQLNQNIANGIRSEKDKTTTYTISLPWASMEVIPAKYPTMGIAIQVNDTDKDAKQQKRISIGGGWVGTPTPGLCEKLAYDSPKNTFASTDINQREIWQLGDKASALISVMSPDAVTLQVYNSIVKKQYALKAGQVNRILLNIEPKNELQNYDISYELINNISGKRIAIGNITAYVPQNTLKELTTRLDSITMANKSNALFCTHLQSVKSLCISEWGKLQMYKNQNFALRNETFKFMLNLNEGFKNKSGLWKTYLNADASIIIAYISPRDKSLQYFALDLPKDWDSTRAYPLYVELHGAGNPHYLSGLSAQLGSAASALDLLGYTSNKTYMQNQGWGYHIMPFGRGNTRYKDIGEIDVWEAYQKVHNMFKIDEDRRYLYGFSMGGGGTWSLATRTPDLWAAVGVFAGGLWNEKPKINIARNLTNTPIAISCGDKDFLYQQNVQMKKLLEKQNITPYFRVQQGMSHTYPDTVQEKVLTWMKQYVRTRPSSFTFIADKDEHTGVWGITMNRNEADSGVPELTCNITDNIVKIITQGTSGLKIDLTDKGLKMKGNTIVYWNDEKKYEGLPKVIELGTMNKDMWEN